jgi:HAD superfamily hydrolase (TIGR01509 family)
MTREAGPGALASNKGSRVRASGEGPRVATTGRRQTARLPQPCTVLRRAVPKFDVPPGPRHVPELDTLASLWQLALDAAQKGVSAAGGPAGMSVTELNLRRRELARERKQTAEMLARLATTARIRPAPWLSPVPVTPQMLGLPATVRACLFDLDGVLTNSGILHALAWAEVFDEFLLRQTEKTGWQFRPFDADADYRAYLEGRPRVEGIHAFLDSRGLRLSEGRPSDLPSTDTAYALAKRKSEALARGLGRHGVTALPEVRRYLEAAGHAGLQRAVISASATTLQMLESAGLATVVEVRVDADAIAMEGLRSRPAPDVLLAACRRVGVVPDEAVAFTQTPAGIAAGRAAGVAVIGIAEGPQRDLLAGFGAERIVPSLGALLDRQLADTAKAGPYQVAGPSVALR